MSRHPSSCPCPPCAFYREVGEQVKNAGTEAQEKRVVQSELEYQGHRKQPESHQSRIEDGRVVRMYVWRSTPVGHLCLVTGPSVEPELYQMEECPTGQEPHIVYLPSRRGRPALTVSQGASASPTSRSRAPTPKSNSAGTGYTQSPRRQNPAKGPQAKDIAPIGAYTSSKGAPDTYFGNLLNKVLVYPGKDWDTALSNAVIRYYIKRAGLSLYISVTKGKSYWNDTHINQTTTGAYSETSDVGKLFEHYFGFKIPYQYTGFDAAKTTADKTDLYTDYHDTKGWIVPGDQTAYLLALIASAAVANKFMLTPHGTDILINSRELKKGGTKSTTSQGTPTGEKVIKTSGNEVVVGVEQVGAYDDYLYLTGWALKPVKDTILKPLGFKWTGKNPSGEVASLPPYVWAWNPQFLGDYDISDAGEDRIPILAAFWLISEALGEASGKVQIKELNDGTREFLSPTGAQEDEDVAEAMKDLQAYIAKQTQNLPLTLKQVQGSNNHWYIIATGKGTYQAKSMLKAYGFKWQGKKGEAKGLPNNVWAYHTSSQDMHDVIQDVADLAEEAGFSVTQVVPSVAEVEKPKKTQAEVKKPLVTPQVPAMEGMTPLGVKGGGGNPYSKRSAWTSPRPYSYVDSAKDGGLPQSLSASEKVAWEAWAKTEVLSIAPAWSLYSPSQIAAQKIIPGTQAGSNPGGKVNYQGWNFYVKDLGPASKLLNLKKAMNETVANQIYRQLGIQAPDMRIGVDQKGRVKVISPWIDNYVKLKPGGKTLDQLAAQFPADAWLANWDVVGLVDDNLLFKSEKGKLKTLRVDNGGAILFRAQGTAKGKDFTDEVLELQTIPQNKPAYFKGAAEKPVGVPMAIAIYAMADISYYAPGKGTGTYLMYLMDQWLMLPPGLYAEGIDGDSAAEAREMFISQAYAKLQERAERIWNHYEILYNQWWDTKSLDEKSDLFGAQAKKATASQPPPEETFWSKDGTAYENFAKVWNKLQGSFLPPLSELQKTSVAHVLSELPIGTVISKWDKEEVDIPEKYDAEIQTEHYYFIKLTQGQWYDDKYKENLSRVFLSTQLLALLKADIPFYISVPEKVPSDLEAGMADAIYEAKDKTEVPVEDSGPEKPYWPLAASFVKSSDGVGVWSVMDLTALAQLDPYKASDIKKILDEMTIGAVVAIKDLSIVSAVPTMPAIDLSLSKFAWVKVSPKKWKKLSTGATGLSKTLAQVIEDRWMAYKEIAVSYVPLAESGLEPQEVPDMGTVEPTPAPSSGSLKKDFKFISPSTSIDYSELEWKKPLDADPNFSSNNWASSYQNNLGWVGYKGHRWLISQPTSGLDQIKVWALSMWLYRQVDVRAAETVIVIETPQEDFGGNPAIMVRIPEGWKQATEKDLSKFIPDLSREMPADAWLANWSVFGPKSGIYWNIWVSPDGSDYMRVNAQGSLNRKWTDGAKPFPADDVAEFKTFIDPAINASTAAMFSDAAKDPAVMLPMAKNIAFNGDMVKEWVAELAGITGSPIDLQASLEGRAKFIENSIIPQLIPKALGRAFGGVSVQAEEPKPKKPKKVSLNCAGALITDGSRILLVKRAAQMSSNPRQWTIPGGAIDAGETPREAALRETKEELGHLPDDIRPAGIEVTAKYPIKGKGARTFHTVVFYVTPQEAALYKPFLGDKRTVHTKETEGWAWVDIDEIEMYDTANGPRAVWIPNLHYGIADPIPFDLGGKKGENLPLLELWKQNNTEWGDFAQSFKASIFGAMTDAQIGQKGWPFAGGEDPSVKLKNPSGYVLSGVKTDSSGTPYIEYRPKMPDGSRPRLRVEVDETGLGLEQGAAEYRMARKFDGVVKGIHDLKPLSEKGGIVQAMGLWPKYALGGFQTIMSWLFGKDATEKDVADAQLLEMAGLPIEDVKPQIKEIIKEVPVEVIKEVMVDCPPGTTKDQIALTADQLGLPVPQVEAISDAQLSFSEVSTIEEVLARFKDLLGTTPSTTSGTAAQKALKKKISQAIGKTTGSGNINTESAVGKWLRVLAHAKMAGLWPDRIDPGRRVVWRGMSSITSKEGLKQAKSLKANKTTVMQVKAMKASGLTVVHDSDWLEHWLSRQATGDGWIRSEDGKEFVPSSSLAPPPSENSSITTFSNYTKQQNTTQHKYPTWAGKPWANVEGYHMNYEGWRHSGNTVSHWDVKLGGGGWGSFQIRSRTDLYPGFIMIPSFNLDGKMPYSGEEEVLLVDIGTKEPVPVQVCKASMAKSVSLTSQQQRAWAGARPPYPVGYKSPAIHGAAFDKQPWTVRRLNPPTKGPVGYRWTVRSKVGKGQWRYRGFADTLQQVAEVAHEFAKTAAPNEGIAIFDGRVLADVVKPVPGQPSQTGAWAKQNPSKKKGDTIVRSQMKALRMLRKAQGPVFWDQGEIFTGDFLEKLPLQRLTDLEAKGFIETTGESPTEVVLTDEGLIWAKHGRSTSNQSKYYLPSAPSKKKKGWPWKTPIEEGGEFIEEVTQAGLFGPPSSYKSGKAWEPPPPPVIPEKREKAEPDQPIMTFMLGIPASGKSTWVAEQIGENTNSVVIDADMWKEYHPKYDPQNPMGVHRWSRDHVKAMFKDIIADPQPGEHVIVDGTGTYPPDVIRDMNLARKAGYYIELRWVAAPLWLALLRNDARERKVPEKIICEKAGQVKRSFEQVAPYADNTEIINTESDPNADFVPPPTPKSGGIGLTRKWIAEVTGEEFSSSSPKRNSGSTWDDGSGTQVQSLMFDRSIFSKSEARSWASQHGFSAPASDLTKNFIRLRQHPPSSFRKGTFKTIVLTEGVKAVIGAPR